MLFSRKIWQRQRTCLLSDSSLLHNTSGSINPSTYPILPCSPRSSFFYSEKLKGLCQCFFLSKYRWHSQTFLPIFCRPKIRYTTPWLSRVEVLRSPCQAQPQESSFKPRERWDMSPQISRRNGSAWCESLEIILLFLAHYIFLSLVPNAVATDPMSFRLEIAAASRHVRSPVSTSRIKKHLKRMARVSSLDDMCNPGEYRRHISTVRRTSKTETWKS